MQNRHSRKFKGLPQIIAAAAVLLLVGRAWADGEGWNLVGADFTSRPVNLVSADDTGVQIQPATGSGSTAVLWDAILRLEHTVPAQGSAAKFNLYLATGDQLAGDPGQPAAASDEKLVWTSPILGKVNIPLDQIVAIGQLGTDPPNLDQARQDDVVNLSNGDSAHGILGQMNESGLALQTNDTTLQLPWTAVQSVLFSTPPGRHVSGDRAFCVRLGDGSSMQAPKITLANNSLVLTLDDKTQCRVDLSEVASIEQVNGPVSWLTGHTPTENVYKPFLQESFPTRFDRTVAEGIPIRTKFPAFHHGIGCHSYSKLVYALDGKYAAFRTQYAIDSRSPLADVTVRLKLDDKVVEERKNVVAGQIYPVIVLNLAGAKSLTLEVDYGENYATEDRFVWLDPALLRALPVPTTAPATQP